MSVRMHPLPDEMLRAALLEEPGLDEIAGLHRAILDRVATTPQVHGPRLRIAWRRDLPLVVPPWQRRAAWALALAALALALLAAAVLVGAALRPPPLRVPGVVAVAPATGGILLVDGNGDVRSASVPGLRGLVRQVGWSPSGDRIAYLTAPLPGDSMWLEIADPIGGRLISKFDHGELGSGRIGPSGWPIQWSADGSRLLVGLVSDGVDESFIVDLETHEIRRLGNSNDDVSGAAWSPDGSAMVWRSVGILSMSSPGRLYVADGDGRGAALVPIDLPDGDTIGWASWAPDSRSVLVGSWGADHERTLRIDRWTGATNVVLDNSSSAIWSPDGRHIAYAVHADTARSNQVWVMQADGSNRRLVADGQCGLLAWAPDASGVLYDLGACEVNPTTVEIREVATDGSGDRTVWSARAIDVIGINDVSWQGFGVARPRR
jgi:hypothetical protein